MAVNWTAEFLLSVWGLRQGKALRDPCRVSTGGVAGPDDEWQAMRYVETTPGFDRYRPVLAWVYVQCKPASLFRVRGPGETLPRALLSNGWAHLLVRSETEMGQILHDEFLQLLRRRLIDHAFIPFRPVAIEHEENFVKTA